jgi:integrase
MNKLKLKRVIAKPNNTSICLYYSKDGAEMMFPTGISISSTKYKSGAYKDWDYTDNMIKPGAADYETSKKKIDSLVKRANDILFNLFNNNLVPTAKELKDLLSKEQKSIIATTNQSIIELYQIFHKSKEEQFNANGTPISLKDFTSTKNLISDFDLYKGESHKIYQFNTIWCQDILNYMKIPHDDDIVNGKFYLTDGKLGGKASKKRFDIFIQFAEFLKSHKLVNQEIIDELKKFRKTNIKVPKTDKITLDIDEIYSLYEFEYEDENKKYKKITDTFIFLCLTGMRYGDYLNFEKRFIHLNKITNVPVYERKAIKTKGSSGINYKIPLCNIVIEILEKYNYKLPYHIKPNIDIKEALKITKLFDEPTNIIDKNTGKEKLKYECISMHKGRDSFITNLVDTTPLNTLMKYTGHSKLSTLQTYIDTSRDIDTSPIINAFNRKS